MNFHPPAAHIRSEADLLAEANPAWFCVQTKPKCEHIAAQNLRQQMDLQVFCPQIRFQRNTKRGMVWFQEALFPGYIFALFDLSQQWRNVQYAHTVSRVLNFAGRFPVIPDEFVDELRRELGDAEIRLIEQHIEIGDVVEVAEGPLRGLAGVVTQLLSGKDRVRVLLEFLGRANVVDVAAKRVASGIPARSRIVGK